MIKSPIPYWLAALHLPGVGPRTVMRWLQHFSNITALFNASTDEWIAAGISKKYSDLFAQIDWRSIDKELAWADTPQHHLIAFDDADYPPLLKEISDPPLLLYVQGDKTALTKMQLGMVGSRNATPHGLQNAEQFAKSLVAEGLVITSGLAQGIDGAAHKGALVANGITIGVAGTGLNHIYPRKHQSLVENIIAQSGAVISEFPLNTPPQAMNFPRRNRIIAGLSIGVLVVESALKSGSLITARHALECSREVFAIPGSIHNPLARGCHHLIRQGAKLVETAADILEELLGYRSSFANTPASKTRVEPPKLEAENLQVFEQIGYEITPTDMIILRSGLTAAEVSSILLTLELRGFIQSVAGGYVRAIDTA